ncbi:MAG: Crp/Fnr family transcriptional regulator [Clostridia bacterium]|nr:Crp/Fnr family transcriptional regulator [Clostridia bacterium]
MGLNAEDSYFVESFANQCSKAQVKLFSKNDVITTYIEKRNQVCILMEGEADLIRYDINGNKTIIRHFIKNDIFGEIFHVTNTNNELFVLAKKDCKVLFYIYDDLFSKCKKTCPFHKELYDNFNKLFLNNIINLNTRIEHLTKRNTRDKLLSYFNLKSSKKHSKTIFISFSYTDLADYLNVDRSAMMRELKFLEDDGFIRRSANKVTLLY